MKTELMGVDIISMLKMLSKEAKHPGIAIDCVIISSLLSKITERVLELDDKELITYCRALYLLQEKEITERGEVYEQS